MSIAKKWLCAVLIVAAIIVGLVLAFLWYYSVPAHLGPVPKGPYEVMHLKRNRGVTGPGAFTLSVKSPTPEIDAYVERVWVKSGWYPSIVTYVPEVDIYFDERHGSVMLLSGLVVINAYGTSIAKAADEDDRKMYEYIRKLKDAPPPPVQP